jgi:hypothetical protein
MVLYLILLSCVFLLWNLYWAFAEMGVSNERYAVGVTRIEIPDFFEPDKVEAVAFVTLEGNSAALAGFFQDPLLVLLDGGDSHYWDADDLKVTAETNDLADAMILASGTPWPASSPITMQIRMEGTGKPLYSRLDGLVLSLRALLANIVFGEFGPNEKNRFFIVLEGKHCRGRKADIQGGSWLQAEIERWLQQPSLFLRAPLASRSLAPRELYPVHHWEQTNYLGFPVFLPEQYGSETISLLKDLITRESARFPVLDAIAKVASHSLSFVILPQHGGKASGSSRFRYTIDPAVPWRIIVWTDEKPCVAEVSSTLAHEFFHAMQWSWKPGFRLKSNHEALSILESGADWFMYFHAGEGKGLEILLESFNPGMVSLWPHWEKTSTRAGHYLLSGFLHWAFLRLEMSPGEFVALLLDATHGGTFEPLVKRLGYERLEEVLREYYLFCWWMGLGGPTPIQSPFLDYFPALAGKPFFASNQSKHFEGIIKDGDIEYSQESVSLKPGQCNYFKGPVSLLKGGWEITGRIPPDELLLLASFLSNGKYLSCRQLNGIDDIRNLRNQIPEGADGWSLFLHRHLPAAASGAAKIEPGEERYPLTIFRHGKVPVGPPGNDLPPAKSNNF